MILKDQNNYIIDLYDGEYDNNPIGEMFPLPKFVILRASIQYAGSRFRERDHRVLDYVAQCRSLGIPFGLYHVLTPNGIAEQAALFMGVWNAVGGSRMGPIVDVEVDLQKSYSGSIGNAVWQGHIKTFIDYVAQGTGKTPVIYTNQNYWNNFVQTRSGLIWSAPAWAKDYPLWVAQYPDFPDTATGPGKLPAGFTQWAIWQWTDKGLANGMPAADLNIANEWYKPELFSSIPVPPDPNPIITWPDKLVAVEGTQTKEYFPK